MFVSARFMKVMDQVVAEDGTVTYVPITDQWIKAFTDDGTEYQHHKDCDMGMWLDYLANGGTVEPYNGEDDLPAHLEKLGGME